jgi:uncharacterized repeat protein (TIGR01451 family)
VSTGTTNVVVPPASTTSSVTTTVAAAVTLTMTKSGPGSVTAGNNITYTLSATNGGPSDAQGVTVTDMVPTGTTFQSLAAPGTFTCNNLPGVGGTGTINCTDNTALAAHASAVFTLVVKATSSDANGSTITNTASVASTTPGSTPGSNMSSSTVNTTVTAAGAVSVSKTAPQNVTAGTNMTYSITVTNAGPSDATGVTVNDTLPASTTFVSETQSPAAPALACNAPAPGGTLTCGPATLTSGSSVVLSVVVHVLATAANGSNIGNTAMVTTTSTNTSTMTSSTANTTVTAVADVAVTKTGPANATAGSNATYTVTVTNNGPSDAQGVTVTESVPANATLVSMTQVPTGGPPAFTQTGPSTFTIATLAGPTTVGGTGASATFQVVLHVNANAANGSANGSMVSDAASVSSTTLDNNTLNNSFTLNTPVVATATLTLTKTGPATITAGTNATYTISLTNTGPSDAVTVSVTDSPLPANTTFVSETQVPAAGATPFICTLVGTTPTCSAPTLPAGGNAAFTLVLHLASSAPPSPPAITNTSNVTTTTTLGAGSVTTATANSNVVTFAALGVTKTGPATITAGTNATFTISVTNTGPSDAQTVTLSDALPAMFTFVSETPLAGFTCTPPAAGPGGTISCTAPTMAAGASGTFSFVVHLASSTPNGTAGSNTATFSSATTPPTNTTPATSTASFTAVAVADLSVTKLASPGTTLEGDSVTYTMTVSNAGPSDAATVTLTETFPSDGGLVSASQSQGTRGNFGNTVTYSLGTIPAGATATAQVVINYAEEGSTVNRATVSSPTTDPNLANNTAAIATDVLEPQTGSSGTSLTIQEGVPLSGVVVATFNHGNGGEPASNFAAVIAWGDGGNSFGTVVSAPGGYWVLGSHTYGDESAANVDHGIAFPITVRIADDNNYIATVVSSAAVQETPLQPPAPAAPHGDQNERYVSELWTDLFGTPAPGNQVKKYATMLDSGVSRRTVARQLIKRAGGAPGVNDHLGLPHFASARGIVKTYFLHFLDRPVSQATIQGHANAVAAGGSLNLLLNLLSNEEYFDKIRF